MSVSRRTLLMLSTAAAATLAGCSTGEQTAANTDVAVTAFVTGPTGRQRLFEDDDVASVGQISDNDSGAAVPIKLTDSAAAAAVDSFETVSADEYPEDAEIEYEIEGDLTAQNTLDISPALAEAVENGEWDGEFLLVANSDSQAETVRAGLREE